MKKGIGFAILTLLLVSSAFQLRKTQIAYTAKQKQPADWFPRYDFDPGKFLESPREFGPFTRWWWPGNDVSSDELRREVKMFADNGFAGVEIQPLTMGLNPNAPKEQADRIYSWDTPSYFEHVAAVMDQARQSAVTVDMNAGSGWPLGGSFFDPRQGMKTLAVSDTALTGGQHFDGLLPVPHNHDAKASGMMAVMMQGNPVDMSWASIESVIAARVVKETNLQTVLDPKSLVNLTRQVKEGRLQWQVPSDGKWRLIVSWDIPTGEKPSLIATKKTSYVVDHLDPAAVSNSYDYLLGPRSGLQSYYGDPLRAIFNDSYEFHTDRMISGDFLTVFTSMHGYDIAPYLSSVFQKGYDHPTYLAALYPNAKPPFVFNESENWRMIYDYDATVNRVFRNNFIGTSDHWMEGHGMLHRTQAYGFPGDLIANAGAADIPEAEQLLSLIHI